MLHLHQSTSPSGIDHFSRSQRTPDTSVASATTASAVGRCRSTSIQMSNRKRLIMISRFFLSCLLFLGAFFLTTLSVGASEERITVHGTGYPPVKAQSKAQALLMAKRAAMLDAYRRALAAQADYAGPQEEGEKFYQGLSGFVKGLSITSEEYLQDGGVKIKATVPRKAISLSSKDKTDRKGIPATGSPRTGGPSSVSVEEWYKIIEKMVRFESSDSNKGEK
jgi:hypothetical protein